MAAAVVSLAGQARLDWAARALPAATRQRSQRSTTTTTISRTAAATRISSSSILARRASRTPTSIILTTRPLTTRTGHRPTTAAATTTSEIQFDLDDRRGAAAAPHAVLILEHDHLRPDRDALVKVDHVFVHHSDTA